MLVCICVCVCVSVGKTNHRFEPWGTSSNKPTFLSCLARVQISRLLENQWQSICFAFSHLFFMAGFLNSQWDCGGTRRRKQVKCWDWYRRSTNQFSFIRRTIHFVSAVIVLSAGNTVYVHVIFYWLKIYQTKIFWVQLILCSCILFLAEHKTRQSIWHLVVCFCYKLS